MVDPFTKEAVIRLSVETLDCLARDIGASREDIFTVVISNGEGRVISAVPCPECFELAGCTLEPAEKFILESEPENGRAPQQLVQQLVKGIQDEISELFTSQSCRYYAVYSQGGSTRQRHCDLRIVDGSGVHINKRFRRG